MTVLYRLNKAKALEEEKKKKIKQGQRQKKLPLGKKQKTLDDPPVVAATVTEKDKVQKMFRLTFRIRFWGIRNRVWFLWPSDVPNFEELTKEVLRQEREREIDETYCISRTVEPN